MEPEAGHGALYAITLDPVASPNVFTTIAQQTGSNPFEITRDSTDITPHNDLWDRHITSRVRKRPVITVEGNYLHGDTSHDGVRDLVLDDPPVTIGLQLTGPSGSASDRMVMSGQFISWKIEHPAGAGVRKFTAQFQPSGNQVRIDGTLIT
jgi:hypothetical protein